MYDYINPDNEHLNELKEYGPELVIEIMEMLPEQYDENIRLIAHGLETIDYEEIQRGVHTIKANLRYFIDVSNPIIVFCQDFETRAKKKYDEIKATGKTEEDVDFFPDYQKLIEIAEEPINEIMRFKEEFKNSTS